MDVFGISSENTRYCFCITPPQILVFVGIVAASLASSLVAVVIFYRRTVLQRLFGPFQYRKLKDNEIRLIVIKPGQYSDPVIRCTIKHVELSQRPLYWCLSYVWGDTSIKKTIMCSGKDFQVCGNLYAALRRIRNPKSESIFWVDAICINQLDVEEKNSQVAMMGRIYSLAAQDVVWLGEEEEFEGKRAFAFLASLDSYFKARSPSYAAGGPIQTSPDLFTGIQQMNFTVLKKLFDQPVFRRLWVVQEVVKSQSPVLLYGTNSVPWAMLSNVLTSLAAIDGGELLSGQVGSLSTQNIASIISTAYNQEKYHLRENSDMDMVTLLYQLRSFDCTEPIDKIYALLGLTWSQGLLPDYTLTAYEATCKFVEWCFRSEGSLNFLFLAGMSPTNVQHDVPSWFPQLSSNESAKPVIVSSIFNSSNVPSSIERKREILRGVTMNGDILTLVGSKFDHVVATTKPFLPYNPEIRGYEEQREMYVELAKTLFECLELAHKCPVEFEDGLDNARYVQFCTTVTVGRWRSQDNGLEILNTFLNRVKKFHEEKDVPELMGSTNEEYLKAYPTASMTGAVIYQRCFAITAENRFALVPRMAQKGDEIVIFKGAKVPFLVRPREDGCFTLVGECYVHGLMMGEVMENPSPNWVEIKLR